jgi:hypothetical protein
MIARNRRYALLSYCCSSILLVNCETSSISAFLSLPTRTTLPQHQNHPRDHSHPVAHIVPYRRSFGNNPTITFVRSSSQNNNEPKNDSFEQEQREQQEVSNDELSNFLWKLEEQQQNRGNMNLSSGQSPSDLPIPFFTSVLILLGSLYVTGYGIYVGLYGFPPEGDTSFVSKLPRIF